MEGGKPEKNPSIMVYLKYRDPELYEAIEDQSIGGLLKPRFGSTMTFLYPADKACRDEIISKLNGADASIGVNMVQAHVIKELLSDPSEWLEKKDNIPNALGQKVELSPASSSKDVVLANGATLTLTKDFKSRDDNIVVWEYKHKSPMPLDGKPAEFVKRAPRAPGAGKKRKNTAGGYGIPLFPRKAVLAKRLQDQAVCLLKEGWQALQESNPFTNTCVSLLDFVKHKHPEALDEFNLLCEPNSISAFYAIVMPFSDNSFFNDAIINEWLQKTRGICLVPNPNAAWISHVQSLANIGARLHEEVIDQKSNGVRGSGVVGISNSIYKKFSNPALRLRGDEMRFVINSTMGKKDDLKPKDLSDLFLDLELVYSKGTEPFFLVNNSRSDPVFLDTVLTFMASRCFASVPVPSNGHTVMSFQDAMTKPNIQIDPAEDLISDDATYLAVTNTNPDSEFITGFKKILSEMPTEMKQNFLSQLA